MADSEVDSKAVGASAVTFVNDSVPGEKSLALPDGESTVRRGRRWVSSICLANDDNGKDLW